MSQIEPDLSSEFFSLSDIETSNSSPDGFQYPEDKDKNGNTQAMRCAMNGIIPPKQSEHDSTLTNNNKQTVAMLLAQNGITQIPKQWQHNSMLKDINKCTVAIYFAKQGIIPPQEWNHQPNILDNNNKTVQDYLKENGVQVPQQWQQQQIIQEQPIYDCFDLAKNGIIPQKQQNFNSSTQDQFGNTVAMYLAQNDIIPPIEWQHYPKLENRSRFTVQQYLEEHKLPIPNCWYQKMPKHLNSSQIEQAIYNQPIQQSQNWKPHYQNNDGWTVAMILARFNRQIPKEWHHDTYIMNKYGQTVEDILKQQGIEIPKEWKCNQKMKSLKRQFCKESKIGYNFNIRPEFNNNPRQETYAIFLARNGVQLQYIPKYYMNQQSMNIKDIDGKTVIDYLQEMAQNQQNNNQPNNNRKWKKQNK